MADGRWLVAGGKDLFTFCRRRAGQTGSLPYANLARPYAKEEILVSCRRWAMRPGIRHWPCLFVPLTGAACAVSLKAKSKDKIPWP